MAHVHTFGQVAPAAAGIIQSVSYELYVVPQPHVLTLGSPCSLGATSCYVTEYARVPDLRESAAEHDVPNLLATRT